MEKLKLLLVDDHDIFLEGLESLLISDDGIEVVGKAFNGLQALDVLGTLSPDLILTDLSMPEMDGIQLVKKVKKLYPDLKIVVLTMHKDREIVSEIMMAEAEGYLLKNTDREELLKAIRRVASGSTYYSNEIMSVILERIQIEKKKETFEIKLTDREQEVLQLISEEKSSEEIAEELFISIRTVETHRKNMLRKTEAGTVIGLLKYGVKTGLISLE